MTRRRVRPGLKASYTTVKKGVIPGLRRVPLEEYERLTGKRVDEFQRVENGNVEFVVEGNGSIRFLRVVESDARYQPGGRHSRGAKNATPESSDDQH